MSTKQVETATVTGTITGSGNATVIVTARDMANSPKTFNVAVTSGDTASLVASAIRTALAFDTDVSTVFLVSGSGANIVLTPHLASANDTTLNIAIDNGTCTGLTATPTSTNTTAGDGLDRAYCSLTEVNNADVMFLSGSSHDTILESTISAVSRAIDNYCGRRFYSASETRYLTSEMSDLLFVDDISTALGLSLYTDNDGDRVYENTWATTDFDLLPFNAVTSGYPFNMISITPNGAFVFPGSKMGVKITASFGWASVPKPINRACVMQSVRIFQRYKTMLGVAGASAMGTVSMQIPSLDSDVCYLLDAYRVLLQV